MNILDPGFFASSPEMVLVDYFLGIGFTLLVPMIIICLAIMITQRS